jgi:ribonuclease HI
MGLSYTRLGEALNLNPELIKLSFNFRPPTIRINNYLNLSKTKEEAIHSVKSLLSDLSYRKDTLLVFSDGSFYPEKGGAGAAFCPQLNIYNALSLGNDSVISNHEAEAAGLLAAIRLVGKVCCNHELQKIVLFVDNKGVILRTMNPLIPQPGQFLFGLIDEAFSALPPGLEITICWCPGHKDIQGNEMADQLAKEAVMNPVSPIFQLKGNWRKITKMVTSDLTVKPAPPSTLPFAMAARINQLASGHCSLNSFLFRINRRFDPLCPFCQGRDTVVHLFNFCPRLKSIRLTLRKSLRASKIKFKSDRLDKVLSQRRADTFVATFLQLSGRFTP